MLRFTVVCAFFAAAIASIGGRGNASPSFDCNSATSAVEFLICGEDRLSDQDFMLSAAYKHLIDMSATLPVDREKLLKDQREWLKSRSHICSIPGKASPSDDVGRFKAIVCLSDLYRDREAALMQTMTDVDREFRHLAPFPADVISTDKIVQGEELSRITDHFQNDGLNRYFHTLRAKIKACDSAENLVVQGAGRDSSYGAHCEVRVDDAIVQVVMCDDNLVGKFAIRLSEAAPSSQSITQFIESACRPGG